MIENIYLPNITYWYVTIPEFGGFMLYGDYISVKRHVQKYSPENFEITEVSKELQQVVALGMAAPSIEGSRANLARTCNKDYGSQHYKDALLLKNIKRIIDSNIKFHVD